MSPAPGPSSPVGEVMPVMGSSNVLGDRDTSAAASSTGQVDTETTSTMMGGPKTCLHCGRHIENSESIQPDEAAINAAIPSPSSVAFVADPSHSTRNSSLRNTSLSNPSEAMNLDGDGHHTCSSCAAREVLTETSQSLDAVVQRSGLQERRRRSSTLRQQAYSTEEVADTAMSAIDVPDQERTQQDATMSAVSSSTSRSRDASTVPWRRAPWARPPGDNASTIPLSLSLSNIGAGGDAQMSNNEDEFPALARSPSAAQGGVHSPRLPTSPTRIGSTTSPPTSPTGTTRPRHPSFSRTQSGTIIAPIPTSPIVNFPSRGRNRAGSASSSSSMNLTGSAASVILPTGRRPSAQRRLSRSNSSQGVKTAALMESSGTNIESEKIEEDPFGPSAMTRPRLSTMTPMQLASTAASNTVLVDVLDRKRSSKEDQEESKGKHILTWFHYDRPDPRRDISKLRCTSRGRGCLFPGAIFNGTQKSGRMSYDVTVQIVNVDMASSHLCGYLNIRGLTDDWPELTTYFDAEIIGQRYGFLTNKWGATEADDMKHWSRFAPFRPLKNSLIKPGLRFNHMNKPFIFMRWKERFLVPDHRVRDINGASFAGFYYVCVELGEEEKTPVIGSLATPLSPSLSNTATSVASTAMANPASTTSIVGAALPPAFTRQRSGSNRRRIASANTIIPPEPPTWQEDNDSMAAAAATAEETTTTTLTEPIVSAPAITGRMSGFYFHEHSEPYQQLTLQHVAERSSSTFELR